MPEVKKGLNVNMSQTGTDITVATLSEMTHSLGLKVRVRPSIG